MKTRKNDTTPELHDIMSILGYRSDKNGLCKGVALTGVQNFLQRNLRHFDRCMGLLLSAEDIEHMEIVDVYALLDSIELFQQPYYHRELFERPLSSKDAETISSLVGSNKKQSDSLMKVGDWRKIYSSSEFSSLCQSLNESAAKFAKANKINFALTLDSFRHMIGLCYDYAENAWIIIDSLHLPSRKISPQQLETELLAIFQSDNKCIGLEICMFSAGNQPDKASKLFRELQDNPDFAKIHSIKPQDAKRHTSTGLTLAHFAAASGRCDELKQISVFNERYLDQPDQFGFTPAFLASQHGKLDVLKFLDKRDSCGIDMVTHAGWTLAHIAAERDRLDILKWLASKKDTALNKADNAGWTPLHIACKEGYADTAQFLVNDHKIPTNQETFLGSTPQSIAKKYGHKKLIQFFETKEPIGDTETSLGQLRVMK